VGKLPTDKRRGRRRKSLFWNDMRKKFPFDQFWPKIMVKSYSLSY
jgi:hypothetical protein